jgi:cold shock CspA family protein
MTGTIKSYDLASSSGVITAEDGLAVGFCPSAVLAYDVPLLTIGQAVSFDLEAGKCPQALNVLVQRAPQAVSAQERRLDLARIRYLGFEHRGSVRVYRFERLVPGEAKRSFTVDADLTLFTKHHVGIQEGPALCLHLLAAELNLDSEAGQQASQCSLTDREMLVYLASRPAPRAKYGAKRTPPAAGPAAGLA